MALHWYSVVVDCHDPAAQARWWAETLGYDIVFEADDEVCLAPGWASEAPVEEEASWHREPQGLVFVPVPEGKDVKNRLHIDLAPHRSQDRDAAVAELIRRGATAVDVGQESDVTWVVLADPEGNEFCVLSARDH